MSSSASIVPHVYEKTIRPVIGLGRPISHLTGRCARRQIGPSRIVGFSRSSPSPCLVNVHEKNTHTHPRTSHRASRALLVRGGSTPRVAVHRSILRSSVSSSLGNTRVVASLPPSVAAHGLPLVAVHSLRTRASQRRPSRRRSPCRLPLPLHLCHH